MTLPGETSTPCRAQVAVCFAQKLSVQIGRAKSTWGRHAQYSAMTPIRPALLAFRHDGRRPVPQNLGTHLDDPAVNHSECLCGAKR